MNRGPQRPMAHARTLELAAQGMVPRYITRELNADPALAEERGGVPIPQRTVSDWVQTAADSGVLAAMVAARQGEPERAGGGSVPPGASDAPGVTAAPAARAPRRSRLDILYATLERQESIAADPTVDERIRVSANDAIARALGILDRITQGQGEDAQARIDDLELTAEELTSVVEHVAYFRRRRAMSDADLIAEVAAGLAEAMPRGALWHLLTREAEFLEAFTLPGGDGERLEGLARAALAAVDARREREREEERQRQAAERDARFITTAEQAARKPW